MVPACNPCPLGGRGGQITRSGDLDHSRQDGQTLSLLKIQKLAGHGSAGLQSPLLGRLRQDNCLNLGGRDCSEPRLRQNSSAPSQKKKKEYIVRIMGLKQFVVT